MKFTQEERGALLYAVEAAITLEERNAEKMAGYAADGTEGAESALERINRGIEALKSAKEKLRMASGPADDAPLGEKLKAVRKAAGLDQRQLAAMTGFSQVDISRWEAGREPKATTLKKLAEALGCSMDDLV